MPTERYFTKSLFNLAQECPAKIYYINKPQYASAKESNEFLHALADGGVQVGALAKCQLVEGVEIATSDKERALQETRSHFDANEFTLFEAAVFHEGFYIRVDILCKEGKELKLIEVKSKSYDSSDSFLTKSGSMSAGWKPYVEDIAFQTAVVREAFSDYQVTLYLMLVDKTKTATVDGLNQRFRITASGVSSGLQEGDSPHVLGNPILTKVPVSEVVEIVLGEGSLLANAREYLTNYQSDARLMSTLGSKCKGCEFRVKKEEREPGQVSGFEECWREQAKLKDKDFGRPSILDLWNFRQTDKCISDGVYFMEDLDIEETLMKRNKGGELSYKSSNAERQHLQIRRTCKERDEYVDPELFAKMESWRFPLHFIDFETCMVAIPFHRNHRTYEQIAFQYSCHRLNEDGSSDHPEWIQKEPGEFPNFAFLSALKSILDVDDGTVFRYAAHENTILRQIRDQLTKAREEGGFGIPDDADSLIQWVDTITEWDEVVIEGTKTRKVRSRGDRNMVDMCGLVQKHYYHPRMGGSNSMKAVLPAVMEASGLLRKKYSQPCSSRNFKDMVWWRESANADQPMDPYRLLPDIFEGVGIEQDELFLESRHIEEGGAAMLAYAKMQFPEMGNDEREAIIAGLLKYCELDTLAMVMLYEHWDTLRAG